MQQNIISNRNAVLIDVRTFGSQHEVINISILIMLMNIYENVEYYARKEAINVLKKTLCDLDINYNNVTFHVICPHIIKSKKRFFHPIQEILVTLDILKYFFKIKKSIDIFFNYNLQFAIPIINISLYIMQNKVFCFCHNEMEIFIDKNRLTGIISKFQRLNFNLCFKFMHINKKMHFILLGEYMLSHIKGLTNDENFEQFHYIDHPYIRKKEKNNIISNEDHNIKIGIPSFISKDRGIDNINNILENTIATNITIYTLSQIQGQIYKTKILHIINSSDMLTPYDDYISYCNQMDYFLILYPAHTYKMTASGSVLEAIWQEKPIIALDNEYIKYIFKKYGEMGIICQNIEDIVRVLNDTQTLKNNIYKYKKNMKNTKEILLPINQMNNLKSIINISIS